MNRAKHISFVIQKFTLIIIVCFFLFLPTSPSVSAIENRLTLVWSSERADETSSTDWGDWDNDGDLDLAVGNHNESTQIYENENGFLTLSWSSIQKNNTFSVAWGDWDNDGDLDLAEGNDNQANLIFENVGGNLNQTPTWTSAEIDKTDDLDWGDWDNDGDIDLAVGNRNQENRVYENKNNTLVLIWTSSISDSTKSVAWGDWDNDGDLDLAIGNNNEQPNYIYETQNGTLSLTPVWQSPDTKNSESVTWADVDNNGFLDLAVGNRDESNQVFFNSGASLSLGWSSIETYRTQSLSWGDWDGDNDLDLAVGNDAQSNQIYENKGGTLTLRWSSQEKFDSQNVSWGDWDNDGDLDLAVGNSHQNIQVYSNGGTSLISKWISNENDLTRSVAWGDWDNDGDLDLAVGNYEEPTRIYENINGTLEFAWATQLKDPTTSVAWGDWDGNGYLDLAIGNYNYYNRIYKNIGGNLTTDQFWYTEETDNTNAVAFGDWDSDGILELAIGNNGKNRIYTNAGGGQILNLVWSSNQSDNTYSIAWGDIDKDGDLDLAVGNYGQQNRVYKNNGNSLSSNPFWNSAESDNSRSIAWGDWDGDGDLDLAVGNESQKNRVYANIGGNLGTNPIWSSTETDKTYSIAWGDWDNDGDIDLAVGNHDQPNQIYMNSNGLQLTWKSTKIEPTQSITWGDWNNDGFLDLAVGNEGYPNIVYSNDSNFYEIGWSSTYSDKSRSISWGDWDSDGDLDLTVGNRDQPNRIFENQNGTLQSTPVWESLASNATESIAWGDWDGDGDLDLATGNYGQPNYVYENNGNSLSINPVWFSTESENTETIAWGDYDSDGDLDLVVGNYGQPNHIYKNIGSTLDKTPIWTSQEADLTRHLAWGDWDKDGDLDLAVANGGQANRIYTNNDGSFQLGWSTAPSASRAIAWGDVNGDGYLDLAIGNYEQTNHIYLNHNGHISNTPDWTSPETDTTLSIALFDWDKDNDLDLFVGNFDDPNRIYRNDNGVFNLVWSSIEVNPTQSIITSDFNHDGDVDIALGNDNNNNRIYYSSQSDNYISHAVDNPSHVFVHTPNPSSSSPYSSAIIHEGPIIPIKYSLYDQENNRVRYIKAHFSLDGGGTWQEATPSASTPIQYLTTAKNGIDHIFIWDLYKDDVFGTSDNVVFRIDAYQGFSGPGPYQYTYQSAQSLPFRIRGSQVRVIQNDGTPVNNAFVLRKTTEDIFIPYQDATGNSFRTNPSGYLQGYGELSIGDELIALAPIAYENKYTVYQTSSTITESGVDPKIVTAPGMQNLTVSDNNPLVLLHLDVALEWDARQDPDYLSQLEADIKRTSEIFYDITNGSFALGNVRLYQGRDAFHEADIVIMASNNQRPNATLGGIVTTPMSETLKTASGTINQGMTIPYAFLPGQVRMGATWNRYGNPGGTSGEDWPRALAHELGHYALFLLDNYIGVSNNSLIATDCQGSAMTDAYRQDYSEFLDRDVLNANGYYWNQPQNPDTNCLQSLAQHTTGRSDWETIETYYPFIAGHNNIQTTGIGPTKLPLAVTNIIYQPVSSVDNTLKTTFFYLEDETGSAVALESGNAQAYLLKTQNDADSSNDILVHLGTPNGPLVHARGIALGDRLCVFDNSLKTIRRTGCINSVTKDTSTITLEKTPGWSPYIQVTPVTSTTLGVTVTQPTPGGQLKVQILPTYRPTDTVKVVSANLSSIGGGQYSANLQFPMTVLHGHVRVWVQGSNPQKETIQPFLVSVGWDGNSFNSWGGNSFNVWDGNSFNAWDGNSFNAWGGNSFNSWGGNSFNAWGGNSFNAWSAPVTGTDGQVKIYNIDDVLGLSPPTLIETLPTPPNLPSWFTVIGQAYSYQTSGSVSSNLAIQFQYLERELLTANENDLSIYYYKSSTQTWQRLPTILDIDHNLATTNLQGDGIYALIATVPLPSFNSGWNLFGYPLHDKRAVPDALASIEGFYTSVYYYDSQTNQWLLYDAMMEQRYRPLVNNLVNLEFGRGYWIYATEDITGYLGIEIGGKVTMVNFEFPPATLYGPIDQDEIEVAVGDLVEVWQGTIKCGQGNVISFGAELVYK